MKNIEDEAKKAAEAFAEAYKIIARLRAPGGCPWDMEQTPLTMRENMIEEAYEAAEAITEGQHEHIVEELGDVLVNALMIALIYQEEGAFTVEGALRALSEKLIRRHPHVFGASDGANSASAAALEHPSTPAEVLRQWEKIKRDVEGKNSNSTLEGVCKSLPPAAMAQKLQKRAARVGFDFPLLEDTWQKVKEEEEELRAEVLAQGSAQKDSDRIEDEAGDFLFAVINLLRHLNVDVDVAIMRANNKFIRRFGYVEKTLVEKGIAIENASLEEMDFLWDEAKQKGL